MRTPTPAQLLQVWERGGDQPVARCSLLLLGISCDEYGDEALAALSLGRRDALLMQLRRRLFGADITAVTDCPQCGGPVQACLRCDDLLLAQPSVPSALEHVSSTHDLHAQFRLPDSNDLLALDECRDAADARRMLLDRCVFAASCAGELREPHSLPAELQAEIAQAMSIADPQADLQLALHCPDCACDWQPVFDIARFLWQELHAWALRMLRDIDALACAYHWTEADILALSPRRRQAYLELCAS